MLSRLYFHRSILFVDRGYMSKRLRKILDGILVAVAGGLVLAAIFLVIRIFIGGLSQEQVAAPNTPPTPSSSSSKSVRSDASTSESSTSSTSSSPTSSSPTSLPSESLLTAPTSFWPHYLVAEDFKNVEGSELLKPTNYGNGDGCEFCVSFGTNSLFGEEPISIKIPNGARTFDAVLGVAERSDEGGVIEARAYLDDQPIKSERVGYLEKSEFNLDVTSADILKLSVTCVESPKMPGRCNVAFGEARFSG